MYVSINILRILPPNSKQSEKDKKKNKQIHPGSSPQIVPGLLILNV